MPAYWLEIGLVLLGLGLMMRDAFAPSPNKQTIAHAAMGGLLIAFVGLFFAQGPKAGDASPLWGFYTVDKLSLFFKGLAIVTTISVIAMSVDYREVLLGYISSPGDAPNAGLSEFFYLPLFTCAGLMWMASATDVVSIFVSLELVTISFYILVAFMRRNVGSLEAGVKYLILGALSTGFLVFGVTWLFGLTGETQLSKIAVQLTDPAKMVAKYPTALLFSLALITVGLGFKLAAVPFQIWAPDVYQGAPTPITAFLSVGSKAAGVAVAYRLLHPFLAGPLTADLTKWISAPLVIVLTTLAAATILFGNLAAIQQTNFKRLLAYSSISHAGFLMLALAAVGTTGNVNVAGTIGLYLAGYLAMSLVCFHVICLISRDASGDAIEDFNGLAARSPFLASVLLLALVSLAGVPFTAGFFGKFYVFFLALQAKHYVAIAMAIVGVAAGFYYYLKVVRSMYWEPSAADAPPLAVPLPSKVLLLGFSLATLALGVYPAPVLRFFGS